MVQIRTMYDLIGERYASPEGSDHLGRTISVRGNLKPIADSSDSWKITELRPKNHSKRPRNEELSTWPFQEFQQLRSSRCR
jgi:hypothetical protein